MFSIIFVLFSSNLNPSSFKSLGGQFIAAINTSIWMNNLAKVQHYLVAVKLIIFLDLVVSTWSTWSAALGNQKEVAHQPI